jgi:hypothetical protein
VHKENAISASRPNASETKDMPTSDQTNRADRLLGKMHRILGHDLPNQIVALQSMLQLLDLESKRLGDDGRECLSRMHRVARKAGGMIRFLKEISRLSTAPRRLEPVALTSIVRELRTELRQQLPSARFDCDLAGDGVAITSDPRRLVLAIVEIVRYLQERLPSCPGKLELHGRPVSDGFELTGELTWADGEARPAQAGRPEAGRPEQSLEIMLAEELLSVWGARLTQVDEDVSHSRFTVQVPTNAPEA